MTEKVIQGPFSFCCGECGTIAGSCCRVRANICERKARITRSTASGSVCTIATRARRSSSVACASSRDILVVVANALTMCSSFAGTINWEGSVNPSLCAISASVSALGVGCIGNAFRFMLKGIPPGRPPKSLAIPLVISHDNVMLNSIHTSVPWRNAPPSGRSVTFVATMPATKYAIRAMTPVHIPAAVAKFCPSSLLDSKELSSVERPMAIPNEANRRRTAKAATTPAASPPQRTRGPNVSTTPSS